MNVFFESLSRFTPPWLTPKGPNRLLSCHCELLCFMRTATFLSLHFSVQYCAVSTILGGVVTSQVLRADQLRPVYSITALLPLSLYPIPNMCMRVFGTQSVLEGSWKQAPPVKAVKTGLNCFLLINGDLISFLSFFSFSNFSYRWGSSNDRNERYKSKSWISIGLLCCVPSCYH